MISRRYIFMFFLTVSNSFFTESFILWILTGFPFISIFSAVVFASGRTIYKMR